MNLRDLAPVQPPAHTCLTARRQQFIQGPVRDRTDHTTAPVGERPANFIDASQRFRFSGQSVRYRRSRNAEFFCPMFGVYTWNSFSVLRGEYASAHA